MITKSFDLKSAIKIHKNFYSYDLVKFEGNTKKVEIMCPLHGVFMQTPRHHIKRGQGCKKCQYFNLRRMFSSNNKEFIKKAKSIHKEKYDYSEVNYINTDKKIKIICLLHGPFYQSPYKHVNKKQGCPKCKFDKLLVLRKDTLNDFLVKAKKIHGEKYDYSSVNYITMFIKVKILCKKHGPFSQAPNNHLFGKNGCPKCGKNISIQEKEWLDSLNIPQDFRQKTIIINKVKYKVDAFNDKTKTIYEFFGFFWHGHPSYFNPDSPNPKNKITFSVLYNRTLERIKLFKKYDYKLIYKWG